MSAGPFSIHESTPIPRPTLAIAALRHNVQTVSNTAMSQFCSTSRSRRIVILMAGLTRVVLICTASLPLLASACFSTDDGDDEVADGDTSTSGDMDTSTSESTDSSETTDTGSSEDTTTTTSDTTTTDTGSSEDTTTTTTTDTTSTDTGPSDPCQECAENSYGPGGACQAEYEACIDNAACADLFACVEACDGDMACGNACYEQASNEAQSLYLPLVGCVVGPDAMSGACGDVC